MAKKTVASLQKAGKSLTKVIKMVKSDKSDAYIFEEGMIAVDHVNEFFSK